MTLPFYLLWQEAAFGKSIGRISSSTTFQHNRYPVPFRRSIFESLSSISPKNVLSRDFAAQRANEVGLGHYLYSNGPGWLYVTVIVDLYSSLIVGWSMSAWNNEQLVLDALEMALGRRALKGRNDFAQRSRTA